MAEGSVPAYRGVVNTFVNSNDFAVNTSSQDVATEGSGTDWVRTSDLALMKRPL